MKASLKSKLSHWLWKIARRIGLCCVVLMCLMASGCVNFIVRHSTNPPHIESVYQCTRMAASGCVVLAFPQMMSDAPTHGFDPMNLITIPLGIVAFCVDVPCEFVLDTVCLPYDAFQMQSPHSQ